MKAKIIGLLAIIAAFTSLESRVQAQSRATSNSNSKNYSLTGDSLIGIDHRTAEDDFAQFFEQNPGSNSTNNEGQNITTEQLRSQELLSFPKTPVFFVPEQSFNGNDGAHLQLDLGN